MKRTYMLIVLAVVYVAVAGVAGAYLAGGLFFLINRTLPHGIGIDTWYLYWQAYHDHAVQHGRLLLSASIPTVLLIALPTWAVLATCTRKRPLHGDARWATEEEMRKAGLL
jgi:type IV secretion system protein VirD4